MAIGVWRCYGGLLFGEGSWAVARFICGLQDEILTMEKPNPPRMSKEEKDK